MENEGSNFPLTYTKYVIQKRKMGEQPSKKSHQKKNRRANDDGDANNSTYIC